MTVQPAPPRRKFRRAIPLALAVLLGGGASVGVAAGAPPASRPANREAANRPGRFVQKLREAVAGLDLSDEQRPGIEESFAAAESEFRELMPRLREMDKQQRRDELKTAVAGLVDDITRQLTPEQKAVFRQDLASIRKGGNPATRPTDPDSAAGTPRMGGVPFPGKTPPPPMTADATPMRGDTQMMGDAAPPADNAQDADAAAAPAARSAFLRKLTDPAGLAVGAKVSDSIRVVTLADEQKPLANLLARRRPTVIVFASLSSPTFRDRLGDLPWLKQQLLGKADLMVLYTREQYPAGQWTVKRNDLDGVSIPPHADLAARMKLLRQVESTAKLGGGVEFVADAMDDAAADTLAGAAPNCAAVVLRPDGTLAARQQWLDPTGIVGLVEAASK